MNKGIYLDNHSTTRVDPRVLEAMLPFFSDCFGNASSGHVFGWEAEDAVEAARKEVAFLLGAKPAEIFFTSGATESDNLALKGSAGNLLPKGNHIITSQTEHKAVLDTCKVLANKGFEVTYLPVDSKGLIDPDQVRQAIREKTILVSIMHANNEIGVVQNLKDIGRVCKEKEVVFHTDAAQSLGKITINVDEAGVDLVAVSAHKMYGPKGVGALYVRSNAGFRLQPITWGGGQEQGVRSGTLNVPAIVGFGKACVIAAAEHEEEGQRVLALREKLRTGLTCELDGVFVNGDIENRLPGNLNLSFSGVSGQSLLTGLQGELAVSSGSACSSHSASASYVLRALGCSEELADSSLRFGIGRFNDEKEIDYAVSRITSLVKQLRGQPSTH